MDLVFESRNGARVFLCGEEDLRPETLARADPDLVITMSDTMRFDGTPRSALLGVAARGCELVDAEIADLGPEAQSPTHADNARRALAALVSALAGGRRTVVHCVGGQHRSPALVYAALYVAGHAPSLRAAFQEVRRRRRKAEWREGIPQWILAQHRPEDEEARRATWGRS